MTKATARKAFNEEGRNSGEALMQESALFAPEK